MLIGDKVIIQSKAGSFTIPATTILQGFRNDDYNGQPMSDVMVEGVHYSWDLRYHWE